MNTKDNWLTTAMIRDEPRRALWSTVFPDGVVPIKSIFTLKLRLPSHHDDVDCYMLDLDALNDEQLNRVVAVIHLRFDIPEDEIRSQLHVQGVPIIADGVIAATQEQGILFSMMDDYDAISYADQFLDEEESVEWEDDCA